MSAWVWLALLLLAVPPPRAAEVTVDWNPIWRMLSVRCYQLNGTLAGLADACVSSGACASNVAVEVQKLRVWGCEPPAEGYAAALRPLAAALAATFEMSVMDPQPGPPLTDALFAGLPLVRLTLVTTNDKYSVSLIYRAEPVRLEEPETMEVWCLFRHEKLADARHLPSPLGRPARSAAVVLRECDMADNISLGQAIAAIADPSAVISLSFRDMMYPPMLRRTHFSDLNLTLFHLDSTEYVDEGTNSLILSSSTMDALSRIPELNLSRVLLPPFPAASIVEQALLTDGNTISEMGGCGALGHLELRQWTIPAEADHFLNGCEALQSLIVEAMEPGAVPRVLAGATRRLRNLTVTRCELVHLSTDLLADAKNLEHLILSDNLLSRIDSMALHAPVALQSLDLSRNGLGGKEVMLALKRARVQALRSVNLDDNPLFRSYVSCDFLYDEYEALEELSMQRVGLDYPCFEGTWPQLRRLRLTGNKITSIWLSLLPRTRGQRYEVELLQNPLQLDPDIGRDGEHGCGADAAGRPWVMPPNVTVRVDLTVDCDCRRHSCAAAQLRKLSKLKNTHVVGVKCIGGGELANATVASVECDLTKCGPCKCRRAWSDNTTAADCKDRGLERIPGEVVATAHLTKLLARGNRLHRLHAEDFPDTLTHVDLRDNGVLRADAAATQRLFARARDFRLGGVLVPCACDSLPFLTALHQNSHMVSDYEQLRCEADGQPLGAVELDRLCAQSLPVWALLIVVSAPVTSVVAIVLLYCRYQRQIKVFLFARGCCLWCLQEDDLGEERPYDAFVSFCHEDDAFVTDQLLPALEKYQLCIHYRDWEAGGWIPDQIAQSVDTSRRTIIVLSKAFLQSQWSLLEFRTAHASTLEEGRARVVVVMLDDVRGDARLDAELRSYLATNTYLRWGDPWFFDKLRYAMPRRAPAVAPAAALPQLRAAMDLYRGTPAADTTSQPAVFEIAEQSV